MKTYTETSDEHSGRGTTLHPGPSFPGGQAMTTKQELETQAAKLRAELEQLDTKIAAMPDDAPEWPWRPENGEMYYWAAGDGQVTSQGWRDTSTDENRLTQGNAFATKEEAERRAELIRLMQPKCARPKKGDDCIFVCTTSFDGAWENLDYRSFDDDQDDRHSWETGLVFPSTQRAEAQAHAEALNDFFSQEATR